MTSLALRPDRGSPRALRWAIWLLALVLPLQGLTGLLAQVAGPSHVHQLGAGAPLLVDFRRAPGPSEDSRVAAARARHGHGHAGDATERHPHHFDDATVRYVDGSRFGDASAHDPGAASDAVAAFLPLWFSSPFWLLSDISHWRRDAPSWNPTAADSVRLDRPPSTAFR